MTAARCTPCWHLLKAVCTYGQDARLCEAFLRYDATGDPTAVETVLTLAPPAVIRQAKMHVVALGLAVEAGAETGGTA